MYWKEKRKKRNMIIGSIVTLCLLVGLCVLIFTNRSKLTFIEKWARDGISFVSKIVTAPIDFVKDKIDESKEKKDLLKKYEDLKQKTDRLDLLEAEKNEARKEVEELKALLELNGTLLDQKVVSATVINRNLNYWDQTLTIDKGESSGITVGMPVVVAKGLIGKVVQTTNLTSSIKLLTSDDAKNKISVKIKVGDTYVYGILTGYNKKLDTYVVEGIAENAPIEPGAEVTTTGMGDIFPSGILVGNVHQITTDNFDLAKILEVRSQVNFDNINVVTVLKRNLIDDNRS